MGFFLQERLSIGYPASGSRRLLQRPQTSLNQRRVGRQKKPSPAKVWFDDKEGKFRIGGKRTAVLVKNKQVAKIVFLIKVMGEIIVDTRINPCSILKRFGPSRILPVNDCLLVGVV